LKIFGSVQGVNYRYHVKAFASRFSLTGWAKNESDGSVSIVAEGTEEDLQNFLEFCYNSTSSAEVKDIKVDWEGAIGDLEKFEIR